MSRAFAAAVLLGMVSCTGSGAQKGDASIEDAGSESASGPFSGSDAATEYVFHTYAPTYSAVWNEILIHDCALEFCHGGSGDYLHLSSEEEGYRSLVNARAQGPRCVDSGLMRVLPYEPASSLMYLKITTPPCGAMMPLTLGARIVLDPREVEQVRTWIECGALDGDAGCSEGGVDDGAIDPRGVEDAAEARDVLDD